MLVMENLREFYYPTSLEEALQYLKEHHLSAMPIGGGVTLSQINKKSITALVDITRLPLDYINETDNEYIIGATTRAINISKSPMLAQFAKGMINEAAKKIGSQLINNAVTVGGDIVQLNTWSSLPPALLAVDAKVKLASADGERIIEIAEFLSKHPLTLLKPGEIVTEVIIPKSEKGQGAFISFTKTHFDYAMINVAAFIEKTEEEIKKVRLVVSGLIVRPMRFPEAEELLLKNDLNEENINSAIEHIANSLAIIDDFRASKEYRKEVTKVLLKRAINH